MELTLAEEVLLLALDEEKGSRGSTVALDQGLAGALLVDLGRRGLVRVDGKNVVAVPGAPPQHPVLARAHQEISGSPKIRSASSWVSRLPRELKPITETVAGPLVQHGVLTEQHVKVLGLFPYTRYPEADPGPERELRARLGVVLAGQHLPDEHDALLFGLLVPLDMVGKLVTGADRRAAKKYAKQIADSGVAGTAVRDAVAAVNSAVIAAVTAGVIGGAAGSG